MGCRLELFSVARPKYRDCRNTDTATLFVEREEHDGL